MTALPECLNADLRAPAAAEIDRLAWIASPQAGVDRRPLDRDGGEVARATSIVRYAAGRDFPSHVHGGGEEFLVLDGVFSDEAGDYPAGTYVRNPPGSRHAPSSREGCEIFVKLRQMRSRGEPRVVVDTRAGTWQAGDAPGHWRLLLHDAGDGSEAVAVERLEAGAEVPERTVAGGEEILLLEGDLALGVERFAARAWIRRPAGSRHGLASAGGCRFWVKRGHLDAGAGT